jgi:hypothetical protein
MSITTVSYNKNVSEKLKTVQYAKDWPVVYVLENGKEMYVGETIIIDN